MAVVLKLDVAQVAALTAEAHQDTERQPGAASQRRPLLLADSSGSTAYPVADVRLVRRDMGVTARRLIWGG